MLVRHTRNQNWWGRCGRAEGGGGGWGGYYEIVFQFDTLDSKASRVGASTSFMGNEFQSLYWFWGGRRSLCNAGVLVVTEQSELFVGMGASFGRDGRRTSGLAFRVGQCARPLWIFGRLQRQSTDSVQVSVASLLQRRPAQPLQAVQHRCCCCSDRTWGVPKPRLRTKCAARLWTASIFAMFFCEYGSQTDAAYSNSGRTKNL